MADVSMLVLSVDGLLFVVGIFEDWWKLFNCLWIRVTENRIFDLLAWLGIFIEALRIFGKHFGLDAGRVTVA